MWEALDTSPHTLSRNLDKIQEPIVCVKANTYLVQQLSKMIYIALAYMYVSTEDSIYSEPPVPFNKSHIICFSTNALCWGK